MIKLILFLSLASLSFASNATCLEQCHQIGMKRCLKKCGNKPNCHDECQKKIEKPCQERCQGLS